MTVEAVAPKKAKCSICTIPLPGWSEVNAAIWDGDPAPENRRSDYRVAGMRAAEAHGVSIKEKAVTQHVEHVERTAHVPTEQHPATARERPVMPVDYDTLTDQASVLGASAISALGIQVQALGAAMPTADLVAVAKVGMGSAQHRASLRSKERRQGELTVAIFGFVGGHMRELPDAEYIDVTPVADLRAEFDEERRLLEAG